MRNYKVILKSVSYTHLFFAEKWTAIKESPPCGWCGLKSSASSMGLPWKCHHLAGGVDWNSRNRIPVAVPGESPPCGWCGLKSYFGRLFVVSLHVTTLRVVWIEIEKSNENQCGWFVTTLRVVWIEICERRSDKKITVSHHLAGGVDWNHSTSNLKIMSIGHHLAGGVDWNRHIVYLL